MPANAIFARTSYRSTEPVAALLARRILPGRAIARRFERTVTGVRVVIASVAVVSRVFFAVNGQTTVAVICVGRNVERKSRDASDERDCQCHLLDCHTSPRIVTCCRDGTRWWVLWIPPRKSIGVRLTKSRMPEQRHCRADRLMSLCPRAQLTAGARPEAPPQGRCDRRSQY